MEFTDTRKMQSTITALVTTIECLQLQVEPIPTILVSLPTRPRKRPPSPVHEYLPGPFDGPFDGPGFNDVLGSMFAKMRAEEERNARIALNYQNQRKSAGEKPQNTPTDDAKARRDANHKYGSPFKPHLNYQKIFSSLFQANHKSNVILAKVLSLLSILYRFVFCSK